jgi:hypothetical protein
MNEYEQMCVIIKHDVITGFTNWISLFMCVQKGVEHSGNYFNYFEGHLFSDAMKFFRK